MTRQLRLPGFQQKPPKGGGVEKGRGKKTKKTGWQLTLGLKEAIFAAIGVVGLMMMSFALGALAGRGDIYRAAYSWGLMSPSSPRMAQWPPGMAPAGGPVAAFPAGKDTSSSPPQTVPVASAPKPAVPSQTHPPVAAKHGKPGVVTGSIAPLTPPVPKETARKKTKSSLHHDHKTREEELRRVRREVVPKLKFLNSFDNTPRTRLPKSKDHEKAQAKSQPSSVRVAHYRHSREAQAKVAELRKKGIKATVKKTRDSQGTLYIVYKPGVSHQTRTEKLAKKPEKSRGLAKKPRIE